MCSISTTFDGEVSNNSSIACIDIGMGIDGEGALVYGLHIQHSLFVFILVAVAYELNCNLYLKKW